jgi:predicted metal-dependent hydrolase
MSAKRNEDITFEVVRSRRATADIVVERDGRVLVRAPESIPDERIEYIGEAKRYWIYKTLAEWRDLNATKVIRELRNGEGFLYLGSSYRLTLVTDQREPLLLKDGRFRLRRDVVEEGDVRAAQAAFSDYYIARGEERIPRRVAYYAAKVGVQPGDVVVRELGYRWASCGTDGKQAFNWKCMMAPPKVIDYIVVHELSHLHFRDHTDAFWNEVDKVMPDYYERKAWLRARGASLDL